MSRLTVRETFFGLSNLPSEQLQTAQELYIDLKEPLERLTKNSHDQIKIGLGLKQIREKHGRNSDLYLGLLSFG